MDLLTQLVVFTLDNQQFALNLRIVERVVHAVELTALPNAPKIILGVINYHGLIIPVANLRERFRMPDRNMELNDHIIIARTKKRTVAMVVDKVLGIIEIIEEKVMVGETIVPKLEYIQGIAKVGDEIILIHDLETFLSLEEERELNQALQAED